MWKYRKNFGKLTAYTEDEIEVHKLFIYNVAADLQPLQLLDYLANFGEVEHFELSDKSGSDQLKVGYVLYKQSQDAATVLAKEKHILVGCELRVKPYYSWGQPNVDTIEDPLGPISPGLMQLNDDCLMIISRYLSVADQLSLGRCYKRCLPLYRSINLDIFEQHTLWEIRDFLMLFGSSVHKVTGPIPRKYHQSMCEFLGLYCVNVRIMSVKQSRLSVKNMIKIFGHLNELEELDLSSCALTNACLLGLTELRKLKKLNLSYNEKLTGRYMNLLPSSIESLNISFCFDVKFSLLPGICKALPQLRELSVKAFHNCSLDVFHQLISGNCCDRLSTLVIWNNPYFDHINSMANMALLPSLSKLIMCQKPPSMLLLKSLVEHKSQQLTHLGINCYLSLHEEQFQEVIKLKALRILELPFNYRMNDRLMEQLGTLPELYKISLRYCDNISANSIMQLLNSCTKLAILELGRCAFFTGKLVHNIIHMIRTDIKLRNNRRELPVKLFLHGSSVYDDTLQHTDVKADDIVHVKILMTLLEHSLPYLVAFIR